MILILSSLLQRALLLRVSEVRCFQYARSICCIGCAWPSCLKRFENDACGQNKLGVMLWKPTETGQKVTKRILIEQKTRTAIHEFHILQLHVLTFKFPTFRLKSKIVLRRKGMLW